MGQIRGSQKSSDEANSSDDSDPTKMKFANEEIDNCRSDMFYLRIMDECTNTGESDDPGRRVGLIRNW